MSELAKAALILGAAMAVLHAPCVLAPGRSRAWIGKFPRNKRAAWVLTAVDLAWAAWLLIGTPLGRFEDLKPYVYVVAPVAFFLIVTFMDELLAARALGGLFLLIPAPLLAVARWHESHLRIVVLLLAYAMAVAGVALVMGPYHFRAVAERVTDSDGHCRRWGIAGVAVGVGVILLGVTLY